MKAWEPLKVLEIAMCYVKCYVKSEKVNRDIFLRISQEHYEKGIWMVWSRYESVSNDSIDEYLILSSIE